MARHTAARSATSRKGVKALEDPHSSATSSMDASQDTSQVIDLNTVQDRMDQHKQQVKQRRQARREMIISRHEENLARIKRDLDDCDAKYDETWRAITRPKLQRLQALIRKKDAIQAEIEQCIMQVEQGFTAVASQIDTAVQQRIERVSA